MTTDSEREFSIIVWGATGFTGTLVAQYLTSKSSAPFAIAGRSKTKLEKVAADLSVIDPKVEPEIIIAKIDDFESLTKMTERAVVVISTVGPYGKYGLEIVRACVSTGTHYCDLSGEPSFNRKIVELFDEEAKKNECCIVSSCGFDSVPSDLGTFLAANRFKQMGLETVDARHSILAVQGGFSGGTVASASLAIESSSFSQMAKMVADPNYLVPGKGPDNDYLPTSVYYDKDHGKWQSPFMMELSNKQIVKRSSHLLGYGSHFKFRESLRSRNLISALVSTALYLVGSVIFLFWPVRALIGRFFPPGTGPSKSTQENGYFKSAVIVEAENGEKVIVNMHGKGDPGYKCTSLIISEVALCLALDSEAFKSQGRYKTLKGGVMTPAAAVGLAGIDRLRRAGVIFELKKI